MKYGLTPRQEEILNMIREYRAKRGFSPTLREISDKLGGLAFSAVATHISNLAAAGYLTKTPGVARSYVPVEEMSGNGRSTA